MIKILSKKTFINEIRVRFYQCFFQQIRALGQQSCTPLDLHTLSESLNEIRKQIDPSNVAAFQDFVEVHMKQIHNMMLNIGNMY